MIGIIKTMRANLIWFVPLVLVAIVIAFDNLLSSYLNVALFMHRLGWSNSLRVSLSPSTYIYFLASGIAILLPFVVAVIPTFFGKDDEEIYRRRYPFSVAIVLAVVIGGFLLEVLIWGSVPLDVGADSEIYVRYIPFMPLPETPLFGPGQALTGSSVHRRSLGGKAGQ